MEVKSFRLNCGSIKILRIRPDISKFPKCMIYDRVSDSVFNCVPTNTANGEFFFSSEGERRIYQ